MKHISDLTRSKQGLFHPVLIFAVVAVFVFFAPLLILPFFNHPTSDDFVCATHLDTKGFLQYQQFIYENWGGRFVATFTGSLFVLKHFLYDHYYLHTLLLILLDFVSIWFVLACVRRFVPDNDSLRKYRLLIVALVVALQYCSTIELSTYLFWFSSSITYHLPMILVQLQIGLWLRFFGPTDPTVSRSRHFLIPLLIFLIVGFNELFIVVQAAIFILAWLAGAHKKSQPLLLASICAYAISTLIVLLSPGNASRFAMVASKGIMSGFAVVLYQLAAITWSIGKNPLSWLVFTFVFLYANQRRPIVQKPALLMVFQSKRWLLPAIIISFVIASLAVAVSGLNGGNIPGRYINPVICSTLLLLLLLSFTEGLNAKPLDITPANSKNRSFIISAFAVGLLCNLYLKEAYVNLATAPVYNAVMEARKKELTAAAFKPGGQVVLVSTYDNAARHYVAGRYQHAPGTLQNLFQQKPGFLFLGDELQSRAGRRILQQFYRLDSILVR
ncbi:hypothetical protein EXU57_05000 [Segetibacter sp. 3557_3]|uniref:DUF6056 family protein n=1 Tax=Segetibacter sp. 3557_3 TaxID=2547429 RepID=UPI00105845BB|nr:DUF6056 family protein [Segetibacter sp. 3557_3]TDH27826.1 hypothetical protein EXU57_05000 [Segetibacter sp. 3557_3]